MDELVNHVENVIARHNLLPDGVGAVVAVSGGVDSMILLHVLHALAPRHRWKLAVAHLNHRLRGKAADEDEQFVRRAARKFKMTFRSAREDVKGFASAQGISIEMAARHLRHRFIANTARALGLKHVFLAHHADDQVELFLLRLMRGSGTQGLGGMEVKAPSPLSRNIALLRPMLEIWKSGLIAYANAHRISFREDETNGTTEILRNRVRHKLVPMLRSEFQGNFERAVLRSMKLIREEGDFVSTEAVLWLKKTRGRSRFDHLHVAIQRRIVQLELLRHGVVPQFEHVERLRLNVNEWVTLGPALIVRRTPDGQIERRTIRSPKLHEDERTIILGPEPFSADYGGVKLEFASVRGGKRPPKKPQTEFFDEGRVGREIVLRHWRDGDRFRPIGMARQVKLQDWFVNQKIPRECRHELVIATTAAGEIFWVEGQRIADGFKVTPATKGILQWSWRRWDGAETQVAVPKRG